MVAREKAIASFVLYREIASNLTIVHCRIRLNIARNIVLASDKVFRQNAQNIRTRKKVNITSQRKMKWRVALRRVTKLLVYRTRRRKLGAFPRNATVVMNKNGHDRDAKLSTHNTWLFLNDFLE